MPSSLPPYRSAFYEERLDWVESLKRTFLAWLAALILGLLIAAFVAGAILFSAKPSLAGEPIKTPKACAELAAIFGATLPETYSQSDAENALAQLDARMILVPEARRCRSAIIKELRK